MSNFNTSFHSKIYVDFKELDMHSHQSVLDFYSENKDGIQQLQFHEYFELRLAYIDSLFEMGRYQHLLEICDETIESVIENNIQYYQGEDIYRKLLLRKSAAHYNLLEYRKSEFILKELIKMNPKDEYSIRFFRKCQHQQLPEYVQNTRNVSLLLFLFTAMVIAFEMSYFGFGKPQNPMSLMIEMARNGVFFIGWIVLISGDVFFRWKVYKDTKRKIQDYGFKIQDVPESMSNEQ